MKIKRGTASVLTVIASFLFLYGCAAGGSANSKNTTAESSALPASQSFMAEASDEFTKEEELLFGEDLSWEDERPPEIYTVADPLEKINRAMFVFNDKLYFWLMKPITQGYRVIVPEPGRNAVKNFFVNAAAPIRIANNILQGKGRDAEAEWTRFLYNSTIGILGFGDPAAAHPELAIRDEDLGQSLATYGIGDGFFIFWPLLGPSTLRDTIGMAGDRFLSPTGYVEPFELSLGISGTNVVNNLSFRIGDYESLKNAAFDPYASFRDAYIQTRQTKIQR